jgi:hypothetical protein
LEHKKLINSHIIPDGFFDRIKANEPNIMLDETNHPKRAPKGVYDQHILCGPCDNRIGVWDGYAQNVLTNDMSGFTVVHENGIVGGWERPTYDYSLLKMFFISLVWRASISSHPFYRRIDIGTKFEDRAHAMISTDDPGDENDFGVTLARLTEPIGHAFLNPHAERLDGVNHVRFYLAGFVAYIKIDQRPYNSALRSFVLTAGQPLKIVKRSIHKGGEAEVFNKVINAPRNKR